MDSRRRISLLGLVCFLGVCPAIGADQPWTFENALQMALDNHPAVQGKIASAYAARSDREGAEWQRYPTPSLEASTGDSIDGDLQGSTAVLALQQPLWTGGRISAGINAASLREEAAGAAVYEMRQEIALKVIAAYGEALRQQERRRYAAKSVQKHEEMVGLISRRVDQEVSAPVDRNFAQSRLFQAQNELSEIQQALRNSFTQLSQLTGRQVSGVSSLSTQKGYLPSNLDLALDEAERHSPQLNRLVFEEKAAGEDIRSSRAVYMPQIVLRAEQSAGEVEDSRVMVVMQAQPGAGFSAITGVKSAKAKENAARLSREAALLELEERVTLDWNEWSEAQLRRKNAVAVSAMSTEVSESYARQYTAGRKSWIEVLNAVREAAQADYTAADADAQATMAALRIRLRTGRLLDAGGIESASK